MTQSEQRAARRAAGLCRDCGVPSGGAYRCQVHAEANYANEVRRKARGAVRNGRPNYVRPRAHARPWHISCDGMPYLDVGFDTREDADAALADLLAPYLAGSRWRRLIRVGVS